MLMENQRVPLNVQSSNVSLSSVPGSTSALAIGMMVRNKDKKLPGFEITNKCHCNEDVCEHSLKL